MRVSVLVLAVAVVALASVASAEPASSKLGRLQERVAMMETASTASASLATLGEAFLAADVSAALAAMSTTQAPAITSFADFIAHHGKAYPSAEVHAAAEANFNANLARVNALNAAHAGQATFSMAAAWMDLAYEEWAAVYTGAKPAEHASSLLEMEAESEFEDDATVMLELEAEAEVEAEVEAEAEAESEAEKAKPKKKAAHKKAAHKKKPAKKKAPAKKKCTVKFKTATAKTKYCKAHKTSPCCPQKHSNPAPIHHNPAPTPHPGPTPQPQPAPPSTPNGYNVLAHCTPIKNQEQCGSCAHHSAIEAYETYLSLKGEPLVQYSPQWLLDCNTDPSNHGCNGSDTGAHWNFMTTHQANTAAAYPYVQKQGTCRGDGPGPVLSGGSNFISYYGGNPSEDAIKSALQAGGPVVIYIEASDAWMSYQGGIMQPSACSSDPSQLNHAVVVVGFGTDAASGQPFWLVRNHWTASWGEQGFIRLAYGQNTCGIANWAIQATA